MNALQSAHELIARARRIAVLTGAGISAESGIPTFRGAGGLWRSFRAEDLATPDAFARDPRLVWEWYDWRRGLIAAAEPNAGHGALAALESRVELTLVTQNVDGLHRRAGSRAPLEIHGSIWTLRCTACGQKREDHAVPLSPLPPRCTCGAPMRPGVVWFGESLPHGLMAHAEAAFKAADLALLIGTSALVWPAAGLGAVAIDAGVAVIEINPEATPYSDQVLGLRGGAATVLPALLEGAQSGAG